MFFLEQHLVSYCNISMFVWNIVPIHVEVNKSEQSEFNEKPVLLYKNVELMAPVKCFYQVLYTKLESMFVMLTLCTSEKVTLLDNRDIRGISLYKYGLHLLGTGMRILANNFIFSLKGAKMFMQNTFNTQQCFTREQ